MSRTKLRDVLLVVDDEALRDSVAACVREAGLNVETASSAAEALDRLRSAVYAVVLLDDEIPGVNGAVVDVLREHRPRSIVFLMSGSNDMRELAVDGSVVQAILHKPLDVADTANVIQGCVSQFRRATATPSPAASRH